MSSSHRRAALVRGPRQSLEQRLAEAIRAEQASAPLQTVTVLIGGTLQRPYLRRRLADLLGGIVGVRLVTAGELGLTLGEPALQAQGRRPLPFLADRVLAGQASRELPGAFVDVADLPGFGGALAQTLRDLRTGDVTPESLAAAAAAEDPEDPDVQRLRHSPRCTPR